MKGATYLVNSVEKINKIVDNKELSKNVASNINENTPLRDISKNGKVMPWKDKKIENLQYSECLQVTNAKKAMNVKNCGRILSFKPTNSGRLKLYQTWFCHSKLCPLCNWRKAMKDTNQLGKIITESLKQYPKGRFIFLTLTTRDTYDKESLKKELHSMGRALTDKFFRYAKIKKNLLGRCRKVEITTKQRNEITMYHQHLHLLLFVKPTYFKNKENYITQKEWGNYWKRAMKLDYNPSVFVETVKPKKSKGKGSIEASAKELGKYQTKSSDYLTDDKDNNVKVVSDLEYALYQNRAITYSGLFEKVRKELNLEDTEDSSLIDTDDNDDDKVIEDAQAILFTWDNRYKNYYYSKYTDYNPSNFGNIMKRPKKKL